MNEPTERIDRGTWWHDGGDAATSGDVLKGLPMGDYRIYAERRVKEPLNVRMAEHLDKLFPDAMAWRMQMLIDEFDLVERPAIPEPVEVPEDVRKAASELSLALRGAPPLGQVDSLVRWVLEQVGDSDG